MMRQLQLAALVSTLSMFCAGCLNMPTPASQITGSYTSGVKYKDYSDAELAVELDSLARRENQLVIAQEQRRKTSEMQAFWWGYGQGDGVEASELANVRGEKEAVRREMEARRSGGSAKPSAKPEPTPKAAPEAKPQVDASGRVIKDYRLQRDAAGNFVKDKDGNFILIPIYEDEQRK
jgi:hypothetical protein